MYSGSLATVLMLAADDDDDDDPELRGSAFAWMFDCCSPSLAGDLGFFASGLSVPPVPSSSSRPLRGGSLCLEGPKCMCSRRGPWIGSYSVN